MGLAQTIYSSINFFLLLWLQYKIYQKSKKDDSKDLYFILLIIIKIMEKYNIQIFDIFTCCSIKTHKINILYLESLENSLNRIGEETELYRKVNRRFNNF